MRIIKNLATRWEFRIESNWSPRAGRGVIGGHALNHRSRCVGMPMGKYISDSCLSGICVPLMASLTPTGSEARQPATFRELPRKARLEKPANPPDSSYGKESDEERKGNERERRAEGRRKKREREKGGKRVRERRTDSLRSVGSTYESEGEQVRECGRSSGPMSARRFDRSANWIAVFPPNEFTYARVNSSQLSFSAPVRGTGPVAISPGRSLYKSCTYTEVGLRFSLFLSLILSFIHPSVPRMNGFNFRREPSTTTAKLYAQHN